MSTRKPYPTDVSDEEWAFVAPYLTLVREDAPPPAAILDSRTLRSTPESGLRATMGPSARRARRCTRRWTLCATGESVELSYVDRGYTGEEPAEKAESHGMRLEVVKHPESRRGFVLLPRRWVVERSFAWATRFRRLAKVYERLPATVAGLHWGRVHNTL